MAQPSGRTHAAAIFSGKKRAADKKRNRRRSLVLAVSSLTYKWKSSVNKTTKLRFSEELNQSKRALKVKFLFN
jgi:hypothetical protein